jgi:hypothetical protein
MKDNKKGAMSLSDVPQLSIIFLLTAVFFIIGIVILGSFQTTQVASANVANESFTMPADEGSITLGHYRVTSISQVLNATNGVYPAVNYTLTNPTTTSSLLTFHENASVCKSGATCRVTYVYNTYDTATPVAIENSINALAEIPNNWLLLIAVIVAAAVVIGIVISNLGGQNMGRV